jgi:hypothetical protein
VTELGAGFSSADAKATEWTEARDHLATAEIYWLSTVLDLADLARWLGGADVDHP